MKSEDQTSQLSQIFEDGEMTQKPIEEPNRPVKDYYALNFSGYRGSKWHIFPTDHPLAQSLCGKKNVKDQAINSLQKLLSETKHFLDQAPGLGTYCQSCLNSAKKLREDSK